MNVPVELLGNAGASRPTSGPLATAVALSHCRSADSDGVVVDGHLVGALLAISN